MLSVSESTGGGRGGVRERGVEREVITGNWQFVLVVWVCFGSEFGGE